MKIRLVITTLLPAVSVLLYSQDREYRKLSLSQRISLEVHSDSHPENLFTRESPGVQN